ncbi:MAG TPA: DUF1592 domain-containing protein [Polyangiaceae bacterium]
MLALAGGCSADLSGLPADAGGPPGSSGAASGSGGSTSGSGGAAPAGGVAGTSGTGGGGSSGAPTDCAGAPSSDPGAPYSRRLTRTEYNNTVRDLLGDTTEPANEFPAEVLTFNANTDYFGFDNDPSVQSVPELLADGYFAVADRLATTATQNLAALVPCASAANRACGEEFVRAFGEKAFRRPLAEDEITRFMAPFDIGAMTDFGSGIRLVVTAMLQSAPFLYRIELGGVADGSWVKPSSFEMASRLSYFLWQTMPDDALFDAARRDELRTPEQVAAQARRMLDSDKARGMVKDFHRQWLGLRGLSTLEKDTSVFPSFDETVAASMLTEADQFVEGVIFSGSGDASSLFRSTTPGRPSGLVTLRAPLSLLAKRNQTSPVLRGKFVREQLLCEHIEPPPPNVNVMVPDLDPNLTTRERFSQHSVDDQCAGCHVMMDPIGFALENYDAVGNWRDTENGERIDVSGSIEQGVGTDVAGPFVGPDELGQRLATSAAQKRCMVTNWFRYANGRAETPADGCELAALSERFAGENHDVKQLIVALTQTSAFLRRRPGGQ